jgi:hypothetical protein
MHRRNKNDQSAYLPPYHAHLKVGGAIEAPPWLQLHRGQSRISGFARDAHASLRFDHAGPSRARVVTAPASCLLRSAARTHFVNGQPLFAAVG